MIRLFVALSLPEYVEDELAGLERGIPGARWVPPENLHLSLRFIGEVRESDAEDIDALLSGIRARGFDLTFRSVGYFGTLQKAHTVWAGVERNDALNHLHDKVDRAVVRAGLPHEGRKFSPHVTLARIKGETGHHLANFLAEHGTFRLGPVRIREFSLYASFLKTSGAVYERLADYALREPALA
jgi:2'-5' RNA ligase